MCCEGSSSHLPVLRTFLCPTGGGRRSSREGRGQLSSAAGSMGLGRWQPAAQLPRQKVPCLPALHTDPAICQVRNLIA